MDSTMRGRMAALMTAASVAVGIAGGFTAPAQAAVGSPAASYCGQGPEKMCASGGKHDKESQHGKKPCCGNSGDTNTVIANNGPKTVVTNNQTFLPVLDCIIQNFDGVNEAVENESQPTEKPVRPTEKPTQMPSLCL